MVSESAEFLCDGPETAPLTLALTHGSGTGMEAPILSFFAAGIAAAGFRVVRFELPFMAATRRDGRRRPPDPAPKLLARWREVIDRLGPDRLAISGRSLGGRMASMVADQAGVRALVCLNYPFHPPRQPEKLRTAHLKDLRTPTLICHGERDPFGTRAEVESYDLSPAIRFHWSPDGDHDFTPRKASGVTTELNQQAALTAVIEFLQEQAERPS